jgi:hypothetical protein
LPDLAKLVNDLDRHVRCVAARAMAQIDPTDPATIPTLVMVANDQQASVDDRVAAVGLIGDMGPRAVAASPVLERLSRQDDPAVRSAAQSALMKVNGPTTRPVAMATTAPTADARRQAPPIEPVKPYVRETPATKSAEQAIVVPAGATAPADDPIPKADVNTFGVERYSPERLAAVKAWIARQTYLTDQQKREHVAHFEEWNRAQEAKVKEIQAAGGR